MKRLFSLFFMEGIIMLKDFFQEGNKIPNNITLTIICERCKQYSTITDTGKSQMVHPEKYDRLLFNKLNNVNIIDSNGNNIFQDVGNSNT